jgi:SSS family solute:Na+ symporter
MRAADLVALAAFLTLLWWTAWRRAANARVFLVADRAVGLFPLVATLVMTEFNTSTLFAFSAAGYRAGPMALALPLVFLIGLAFYTATVARPWKRFNRLSVAELFAVRYSPGLGRFAAVMLLVAMTGFCATYVKSLELLARTVLPSVPPALATALLTSLMTVVVLPGGLLSVVRSDIAGFIVTLVLLPALLIVGAWRSEVVGGLSLVFPPDQRVVDPVAQWTHATLPFRFVTTLIVLTCFTYIAAPWYGQKIFAAKNDRTAVAAVAWASVLVFALTARPCWRPPTFVSSGPTWWIRSSSCRQ